MSWNEFWPTLAQIALAGIVLALILMLVFLVISFGVAMLRTAFGRGPQRKSAKPSFADGGFVADTSGNQHHG